MITDIHAHILPDVDDGPSDEEQSKQLLSAFWDSGVDRIISTSHYQSPYFDVSRGQLRKAFEATKDLGAENSDDFRKCPTLVLGAEVRLSSRLLDDIAENTVPTLGDTSYVLVEFASNEISADSMEMVYELTIRGLKPIMAHPERNVAIQKNNKLLDQLYELGLVFQLTAGCFIHRRNQGHLMEKLAWLILKNNQAALIASDAHNTTTRPPVLVPAYDVIGLELGQQVVDQLMENANAVWDGKPCEPVIVSKRAKKRFGLFAMIR